MIYKCHHCNVTIINSTPCHETGCTGTFEISHRNKLYQKVQVWRLDVWGNRHHGFEINDRSKLGTCLIPMDSNDSDLFKLLKKAGFMYKRMKHSSLTISGDEHGFYIDRKKTGEPILQIEVL